MDDVLAWLETDPAAYDVVAAAILCAVVEADRAVRLEQLRLLRRGAGRGTRTRLTLRERATALCDRSRAALDRSRWLRAQSAQFVPYPEAGGRTCL